MERQLPSSVGPITHGVPPMFQTASIEERTYWQERYRNLLGERLQQEQRQISRGAPQQLEPHFESYLTLLREARIYPELHAPSAELVATLHPWPTRWGQWRSWGIELLFAAEVFGAQQRLREQSEFLSHAATAHFHSGQIEQALALGQRGLALATAQHHVQLLPETGFVLIEILNSQQLSAEVTELRDRLEAELRALQPYVPADSWRVAWTRFLVRCMWERLPPYTQGDPRAWQLELDALLATLAEQPNLTPESLRDIYGYSSLLYRRYGACEAALTYLERKIVLATQLGDRFAEERETGNLALIYLKLGRLDDAIAAYRRRIAWCEQTQEYWFLLWSITFMGSVYLARGELLTALEWEERRLALAQRLQDAYHLADVPADQARAYMGLGDFATAALLFERWLATCVVPRATSTIERLNLSLCYVRLQRQADARKLAENALAAAEELQFPALQGIAWRCLAHSYPPAERNPLLIQALDLLEGQWRFLDEADCYLLQANAAEHPAERDRLWEQGAQILELGGGSAWLIGATPEQLPCLPVLGLF